MIRSRFYFWQKPIPDAAVFMWEKTDHDDQEWYVFNSDQKTVTKYLCLGSSELLIMLTKKHSKCVMMYAGPKNLADYSKFFRLKPEEEILVEDLDFSGLKKRQLVYINSTQDNFTKTSYYSVDVKVRQILDTRTEVIDFLRTKKIELNASYPEFEFEHGVIQYYTYDVLHAGSLSFDTLIMLNQLGQYELEEQFGTDNFYDASFDRLCRNDP